MLLTLNEDDTKLRARSDMLRISVVACSAVYAPIVHMEIFSPVNGSKPCRAAGSRMQAS